MSSYELLLRPDSTTNLYQGDASRFSSDAHLPIPDDLHSSHDEDGINYAVDDRSITSLPTLISHATNLERRGRFQGWRFGVVCCAFAASFVLVLNSILAILAHTVFPRSDGITTLHEGSCAVVNTWSMILHALINILGSVLLGASNYTMQCLAAPTRKDLDRVHAKGNWLDIGVPSVRHLALRIPRQRILLWWILAVSSVPIHLLYNSAIFKTVSATDHGKFSGSASH